jgi:cellobiose transport system substrate-binding protein
VELRDQAAEDGITAGLQQFTPAWNKAFSSGAFAVWPARLDDGLHPGPGGRRLRRQVGHRSGAPGRRDQLGRVVAGRPGQAAHKDAAIALVEWLSAKDQQVTMWTQAAGRTSRRTHDGRGPAVSNAKSAYFSNAPVGRSSVTSPAR